MVCSFWCVFGCAWCFAANSACISSKTPSARNLNVKKIPEGHYCHFGVANGIQNLFQQRYINPYQDPKEILLQINIDGLPLFKSTDYQLWPILGMVIGLRVKRPFVIGLYGGNRKPSDVAQYLEDFVKESQCLEVNGINLGSSVWVFKIHSIMCDAPARSFVRNTKGHTVVVHGSRRHGCHRKSRARKK